ncbi:transportin-3 [Spodoptera frugiperda]|uniref:Transportin-3 n=1 Tax=Spodoptera frugiperda TaxID=7108 RepID=A0A9R0EH09_SPOFR|nr:transportin-3 [Spodoptera frugiperda]
MDAPTMDTIYQAISALYDNPNVGEKEKASLWLGDMQTSIHSWKIADELLQKRKDMNSCYFAAQTMRSKVQHSLNELPPDSLVSLRDSLVAHLELTSPETSASVLTQLALALADLALQMPQWQNCIGDLIKSFSNKNDFALLEILTVLPQEIDSPTLKLGENRREEIKSELRSNAHLVNLFLKESITNFQNSHVTLKVIKCMTSWIQVKAINIQEVPQNAVIGYSLQILRDPKTINTLHDAASDCITALLHCLEENNNNDNIERLLFESVSGLEESYHMAVAYEEDEKATNYARIFTELAETFLEKIIISMSGGSSHFALRSLELALVCVGNHDYEVAEITFNLWYRLSEEVYQRDYQPLTDAFKPHIERLIEGLARHCQCEPDTQQMLDEGDEFYEFRSKAMGLIKDVVFIVGSSSVFRQMFSVLNPDITWEQTEAALFVMQAVAKNILPEEYEYVPKVVEAILSMPEGTHLAVRKTCILLLGELCEWIERHSECLEPCLQFLTRALHDKQLAYSAATALQNICRACRSQASQHVSGLLRAAAVADQLPLNAHASAALMRALASAIGRLPNEQLTVAMREAVGIQINGLSELMKSNVEITKGTSSDPTVWLDRMAALFRDVDVQSSQITDTHPCVPALSDAWPVLQEALDKYAMDGRVMERWCRCVRFGVRMGGRRAAGLAPALAARLQAVYRARAHSCVLYLASVLLDELAAEPTAVAPLVQLLQDVMPRAFLLLQQDNGLKENPDTVDDLFRLCIRFLQRIPQEFLSSGALPTVMQCASLACCLDHRDANSSVMKFLYDFTKVANSTRSDKQQIKALADNALTTYGEELTYRLMEASVLHLHSYMLSEVAEVMLELLEWQRAAGRDWLQAALQRLPRDRPAVATQQQCWQFHQYAMRAEKCKEMTRLLRDFARLYR